VAEDAHTNQIIVKALLEEMGHAVTIVENGQLALDALAQGSFDLVVLGLLISVPIVVFGSTLVLKMVERWPVIINIGAAVLAFTAAKMITDETLLDPIFNGTARIHEIARWATYAIAIALVLVVSKYAARKTSTNSNTLSSTTLVNQKT
jgi:predicted tellurium resistance membrane protein TerC